VPWPPAAIGVLEGECRSRWLGPGSGGWGGGTVSGPTTERECHGPHWTGSLGRLQGTAVCPERLAQSRKVCHRGGEHVGADRFSDVSVSGPDGSGSILLSRESGEVMALAESLGEQCAARFTPCRNECVCPGNRNDVDYAP
jgi:hypothetical protein